MYKNESKKTCGMFVFNTKKELLVILPSGEKYWEIPTWNHNYNEEYLDVARKAVFELSGIDLFNRKDELFAPIRYTNSPDALITYYILNEDTPESFECYETYNGEKTIQNWDFVTLDDAKDVLITKHANLLYQINFSFKPRFVEYGTTLW